MYKSSRTRLHIQVSGMIGGKIMKTETMSFKVALNNEAKKMGDFHDVEIHVRRPADIPTIVWDFAIAAYKVRLQGQIRNNWSQFVADTFPKTLSFGESLYVKTKSAKITVDTAADFLNTGSAEEILVKKIDLLEKMEVEVPQELRDRLETLRRQQ